VWLAETVAQGILWQAYQYGTEIAASTDPNPGTWRRFSFHWANLGTADPADDQFFTIDIVNITNGAVDSTWTAGDYNLLQPALDSFVAGIAAHTSSLMTCDYVDVYKMAFRPYSDPKPFALTGAPEHRYTMNHPGTNTPNFPQVCSSVTEITLNRRHWGRFYTPTLGAQACDIATGRVHATAVNSLASTVETFYAALYAFEFQPVVPTTQVDKVPTRTLQYVNGIRVDDVSDVQRKRRYVQAQLKVTKPS
jgi:hypothetical protein